MSKRVVAALEPPHVFGRPAEALANLDESLAALSGVDLVLLPETALTGYVSPEGDYDLSRFAEPLDGATARGLSALAKKHRLALVGPLVERVGALSFNGLLGFDREGELVLRYHKRHPWYPERWATRGRLGYPLVELAGLRVTAAICFDLHFLSHEQDAEDALFDAELFLFSSAWVEDPAAPGDSRAPLLSEVAESYACPVLNANWGRGEPYVPGQGGSRFLDGDGLELARSEHGEPVIRELDA